MDKLKREYIELQTRIDTEDVGEIGQMLIKTEDSTTKLLNFKLVNSIKSEGGESKR
jgi:hypothetical protein